MELDKEEFTRIFNIFKEECEEHIKELNEGFLSLEKEPKQPALLRELFRHSHSIKGSARMMGFSSIEKVAHAIETILGKIQDEEMNIEKKVMGALYKGIDFLAESIECLRQGKDEAEIRNEEILEYLYPFTTAAKKEVMFSAGDTPSSQNTKEEANKKPLESSDTSTAAKASESPLPPPSQDQKWERRKTDRSPEKQKLPTGRRKADTFAYETIRVATKKLDDLMNQVGELLIAKIKIDQRLQDVRKMIDFSDDFQKVLQQAQKMANLSGEQLAVSALDHYKNLLHKVNERVIEMDKELSLFYHNLSEDRNQMSLISNELQRDVKKTRMLPFYTAVEVIPRMVRDLANEEGKDVRLEIEGGEVELDKSILEKIKDPLIHLIRNAVDHGIEAPEERKKKGKPMEGTITIRASQHGDSIIIDIEDDGNGIQLDEIRSVALKKELFTSGQLEQMTERQILDIIFQPGFSTSKILTDVSGRGVGMDVVRTNIEKLKGLINVDYTPGKGSTFTIKLPLTMITLQTLKAQVQEEIYSIPTSSIEKTVTISPEQIFTIEGQEAIDYNHRPIPIVCMEEILELSPVKEMVGNGKRPAVILGSAEKRVAFLIDKLMGEDVVVAKSLGSHLERVRNISGAAILGNGRVSLILNVSDLIESARCQKLKKSGMKELEAREDTKKSILVIEDSVTTRTLEVSILESAGYEVAAATDGQDGYSKLMKQEFDLVVADVEMPRMDGFILTQKVKSDLQYQHIPVILLTSLESPAEKKRGIEVGADAYITKSSFDQNSLLDTVKRLI